MYFIVANIYSEIGTKKMGMLIDVFFYFLCVYVHTYVCITKSYTQCLPQALCLGITPG